VPHPHTDIKTGGKILFSVILLRFGRGYFPASFAARAKQKQNGNKQQNWFPFYQ
jgi:hypothetical protein